MKDRLLTSSALTGPTLAYDEPRSRWRRYGARIGAAGIIAIASAALPLAFGTDQSAFSVSSARAQSADDSSTLVETDDSGMDSPDDLDDSDEDEHGDDGDDDDGEHGADDSGEHGEGGADDGGEHGDTGDGGEGGEHGDGGSGSGGSGGSGSGGGEGGDD